MKHTSQQDGQPLITLMQHAAQEQKRHVLPPRNFVVLKAMVNNCALYVCCGMAVRSTLMAKIEAYLELQCLNLLLQTEILLRKGCSI